MKKKLKVLALFDAVRPTTIDQDLSKEMKTEDWKTEANVLAALGELGYTTEHLAIFDDLDLLRQKLESFAPDVIFNLADQFKNNRGFDQNIVSFLEMQGVPVHRLRRDRARPLQAQGDLEKNPRLSSHPRAELRGHPARPADRAAEAAEVSDPGEAGEGRGVLRDFAGVVRRDRRAVQGARRVHSRETRRRRDRGGIHRGPRTLRQRDGQLSG